MLAGAEFGVQCCTCHFSMSRYAMTSKWALFFTVCGDNLINGAITAPGPALTIIWAVVVKARTLQCFIFSTQNEKLRRIVMWITAKHAADRVGCLFTL